MIDAYITGEREVVAHFERRSENLSKELDTAIKRLTVRLQTKVKTEKLSGQVLGVRTGRGRRSIQQTSFREGDRVVGVVSTNVFYMIGWETGWGGAGSEQLAAAKGKFNPKSGVAKPRKRSFLVPSLAEMESSGAIRGEFEAAADRAMA
jgi:hypothetical protein